MGKKEETNVEDLEDSDGDDLPDIESQEEEPKKKIVKKKPKDADVSPPKQKVPKKPKPDEKNLPKKKTIQRVIDKSGKVKFVTKKVAADETPPQKPEKPRPKPQQTPQDYLKILELAQKNVEKDEARAKPSKVDSKSTTKKVKELSMKSTNHKPSQHLKEVKDSPKTPDPIRTKEVKQEDSEKKIVSENRDHKLSLPLKSQSSKKQKIFASALDVPYETLKKPKVVKKLNSTPEKKAPSSPKTPQPTSPIKAKKIETKKYKEEFSEEDEELDDNEEFAPLEPIENIRRSKRPPKKKSFGDEMIMFDEADGESEEKEEESVEEEEEEEEESVAFKRRKSSGPARRHSKVTVDLEVVDNLPDISGMVSRHC